MKDLQGGIFAVSLKNIFLEFVGKTHLLFHNGQKYITHVKTNVKKFTWPNNEHFS